MEFASNAAAFLVLQGHQVSRETAKGLFRLLKKLGLLFEGLVGFAAIGDIFDGEEDQGLFGIEAAGIENHDAFAEVLKIVGHLEIIHAGSLLDNFLEQGAERGNVPLAVTKLENCAIDGIFAGHVKRIVENGVGDEHAEIGVQDQDGFASGVDEGVGVG